MNKEEINEKRIAEIHKYLFPELSKEIKDIFDNLCKQVDNLQQRIDKATGYIKNVINIWETKPSEIATLDLEELLEILGGKE